MRDVGEHLLRLLLERRLVELGAVGRDRQLAETKTNPPAQTEWL